MEMGVLYTLKYMLCQFILDVIILKIDDLHKKRIDEERKAMNTSQQTMRNIPSTPNINKT